MKYLLILLVSATSLILVNGKIPSYIHICKRNDLQINECIAKSILALKDKLARGIPELGVPSLDPQHVEKVTLDLGPGFKAEGRNLLVKGGKNFEIRDLVADIKANTYSFAVSFPEMTADGTYEVEAAIAGIPLRGKGPIHITAKSVSGQGTLHGKEVVRDGKIHNWFPSMELKLSIDDYDIELKNLFGGDPIIGEITNKLLKEQKTEILASVLPELERIVIEYNLRAANNIVKRFTWDELFPES